MNLRLFSSIILLFSFILLAFTACKKEQVDTDTNAAKNENLAEKTFNELGDISDEVARSGNLSSFKLEEDAGLLSSNCATITFDTSSSVSETNPNKIIIDFGTACTGNDGKVRSGKLIISITGKYMDQGTIITITPTDYVVNGHAISGYRKVTNLGTNPSGQPYFSVEVVGAISLATGGEITWVSSRTRTWIQGYTTPLFFADDIVSIEGNSNGTHSSGTNWTAEITAPLLFKRVCRELVGGALEITPISLPPRSINFGNGQTCDGQATVTINGNVYTIPLS